MTQAPEQMDVDNTANTSASKKSGLPELLNASSPAVQEKYKAAGTIANTVLHALIKSCSPGVSVVELCKLGDMMIDSETSKVFPALKSRGQKGIAFPTCISVNEIAGHYSPFSDDNKKLAPGDMVKIDLGVHIDGFTALVAHTIVLGQIKGKKADVIAATWSAAQAALRLLKPKNKVSSNFFFFKIIKLLLLLLWM
ncbi:aminopeptidase/ metalloexopeptidase [Reticulomyxa filosa]|uniref:Aminopeptidase/ metalloexopeptidase n=1 Tax=Reticulomyxa filosa TaxID=46433 RepID=X6LQC4_RETFI|nr:aminopeptidase/ metalloexopeptidase [Reticulomyxa filosa]|eukprot:ETO03829.1 aminopeptidase/ metalloexopeptidase [Reticulomyxa filosa]